MISVLSNLGVSFLAGLFAPIAAVCVLPLYPGFLAYLSNQISKSDKNSKKLIMFLGLLTTFGVISSMVIFGLIFTKIFQASLTNAIGIISPIAFSILALVSIFLFFDVNFGRFFPKIDAPILKSPYTSSFLFGFFFGIIVLPCNPASLIILFALSTTTAGFILNFLNFIVFGVGMAAPLLIFAILTTAKSQSIIGFLTTHKRAINRIAGILMLGISLYYIIFVFNLYGFLA